MSVSSIGSQSTLMLQSLLGMRSDLNDLSRQLSTGQKSETYAGLGLDRGLSVGLRSQLSGIKAYDTTMQVVGTRLSVAQTTLQRLASIGDEVKTSVTQSTYDPDSVGQTTAQHV